MDLGKRFRNLRAGLAVLFLMAMMGAPGGAWAKGKTLVVALEQETTTLEAHLTTDVTSTSVRCHLYNTLLRLNTEKLEFEPELALKWQMSPDGKIYTFQLRKGVKFHDGSPFNAEAVKFNFDRLIDPKRSSAAKNNVDMIERVEVVDEYTVRMHLKSAFAPFLNHLNHPGAGAVMSMNALKQHGDKIGINPVGTGPFKFVKWLKGSEIVLERFDGYWGEKPYFERIVFKPVPEEASRIMMLETGEADVANQLSPIAIEQLKKNKNIDVIVKPSIKDMVFAINCEESPTNDVRVRQAINLAVNKEEINNKILGGVFDIANSPVAKGIYGHKSYKPIEYNPEKAKQLLKEAGYKGEELVMWAPQGKYPMGDETSQMVQNYLRAVGMNPKLTIWGDYPAYLAAPAKFGIKFNLKMEGWSASSMDGDMSLWQIYHSSLKGRNFNRSNFDNKEFDQLMAQSRNTLDPKERTRILHKAQDLVWQGLPTLWLFRQAYIVAAQKDVKGIYLRPSQHIYLMDCYRQ